MKHCLPEKVLLYWSGELPQEERAELHQHLKACRTCTSYLEELQQYDRWAEQEPLPRPGRDLVGPAMKRALAKPRGELVMFLKPLAAAAALLALLGIGILLPRGGNTPTVADNQPTLQLEAFTMASLESRIEAAEETAARAATSFTLAKTVKRDREFGVTEKPKIRKLRKRMERLRQRLDSGPVAETMLPEDFGRNYI